MQSSNGANFPNRIVLVKSRKFHIDVESEGVKPRKLYKSRKIVNRTVYSLEPWNWGLGPV